MDLDDYFMTLVEEEYDCLESIYDRDGWIEKYHSTEYDTADYCTDFINGFRFPAPLINAILGSVCWEKVWKHLMEYHKEQQEYNNERAKEQKENA